MTTDRRGRCLSMRIVRAVTAPAFAIAALTMTTPALASGGDVPFSYKPNTTNEASLQRGARAYMDYCVGCHSLKYLRYNRLAQDLSIPDELLRKYLMYTTDKVGDTIKVAMPAESETWFGRVPPDLSLTARERGPNWVYSYLLTFYLDPSRPNGVNNLVLPNASMPHVLGGLQGWQAKIEDKPEVPGDRGHQDTKLEVVQKGSMHPAEYKAFVGDLTNFLVYAAEPTRNHRMAVGFGVLAFVFVFGIFAYLLKVEYWKDVH